jgi:hypothetical protein
MRASPAKEYRLDLEPVPGEEPLAHADIERHERERLGHRLADAKLFGGLDRRGDKQCQRGGADDGAEQRFHWRSPSKIA